jgi:XRE family transcriptional regulator of biofilm formation
MIGKTISDIRKQRGLTLTELAERSSISKSYLSNIERNFNQNPSLQVMSKIAKVLGIDVKTLLKPEVNSESQNLLDNEWLEFVHELKETGIDKEQLQEYKTILEFIKWQNQQSGETDKGN